ncbi:phage tail tape measure protein [Phytohabitans kaempferiae]|uniref:Phage tail tape measure protein n=1 Tax=Phytohabitans kaempferiae TaxID=1620943 RepID=A0ABV6LZH9_9ACTN
MSTLADLLIRVGIDSGGVDKGARGIAGKLEKTWGHMKQTAAVAGAAAGAAAAAGVMKTMELGAANDKLAAQLGATAEEADRLGKVAGDLYAGGWAASVDEVNNAVGSVVSSIEGMRSASGAALEDMSTKALAFAQAFELDVADAAQYAGSLIHNGLAKDGTEAFDLLTVASRKVPKKLVPDVLEVANEYGQFFKMVGFSGNEAFGLLTAAAGKGSWGIDKAADAVKEFGILATELDGPAAEAFKTLGFNARTMSTDLLAGGDTARAAFEKTVTGLLKVKDPADQAQLALKLFGAPLEDLSKSEIPDFLKTLDAASAGLGKTEGASAGLVDQLSGNAKSSLLAFKNSAEMALVGALEKAAPWLEKTAKFLQDNASWVVPLVATLATFAAVVYAIIVAMKIWTAVQAAWGIVTAISLGPITLIVLAIIALIAIIVLIAKKTDWFGKLWGVIWGAIKAAFWAAVDFIVGYWKWVIGLIVSVAKAWWSLFSGFWTGAWKWITDKIGDFVGFVKGLKTKITSAAKGVFDGFVAAIKGGINTVIRLWNRLDLGWEIAIPSFVPLIGGKRFSIPDLIPDIPMLADGGIVGARPGGTLALLGEGGQDEAVVPLPRGVKRMGAGGGDTHVTVQGGGGSSAEQKIVDLILFLIRTGKIKLRVRSNGDVAVVSS